MRVVHAQAERILAEYKDSGVPGYEKLEYELGAPDENGHADLEIVGNQHASPEAFANAAGIVTAPTLQASPTCIAKPEIIGLPNVGQYVTASAGVWDDGDDDVVRRAVEGVQRPSTTIRWLYDGNEEDPVVIPEGDPHMYGGGRQELLIPAAAIGRTIQLRVTRGRTTVYSDDFGPIEGGLTEFTFPALPVRDSDQVSADPGSRLASGASAPVAKTKQSAQTPSSGTGKLKAKGTGAKKSTPPKPATDRKKSAALAKRAAEETKPKPAQDRVSE